MDPITFTVYGKARPKGSVEPVGGGRVRHRNEGWQTLVALVAQQQLPAGAPLWTGPVGVELVFYLPKPASAPKRRYTWPIKRSALDLDKGVRSVGDALTGTVIADDSQIVTMDAVKEWAEDGRPRIVVTVWQIAPLDGDAR